MAMKNMTREELTLYNREAKRKQRFGERKIRDHQAELAARFTASEWFDEFETEFSAESEFLRERKNEFAVKVFQELNRGEFNEHFSKEDENFSILTICLFCLKNGKAPWIRKVYEPNGVVAGGLYFPDAVGSGLIENSSRLELKESPMFLELYMELLKILDKRFGDDQTEHSRDCKLELAGKYTLPAPLPEVVKPEPKVEPIKVQEVPSTPTTTEILQEGRIKLLDQLSSDNM